MGLAAPTRIQEMHTFTRFEVLTTVLLKVQVFFDLTPYLLVITDALKEFFHEDCLALNIKAVRCFETSETP